jgi:hypothetical protein
MRFQVSALVWTLLLFILVVTLSGCEREEPPSMVLLNSSSPPCWFNICPGTTRKQEAMTLLATVPYVDLSTIVDKSVNQGASYIHWNFTSDVQDLGRIFYTGTTVTYISITPRPEDSLTFDEIITTYGEPEQLWAFSDCADSRWLYVALIYREKGVYVAYFDDDWERGEPAELTPGHLVDEVIYYDPILFEDLMMSFEGANWLEYGYTFEDILKYLQTWQGFKEINVIKQCY